MQQVIKRDNVNGGYIWLTYFGGTLLDALTSTHKDVASLFECMYRYVEKAGPFNNTVWEVLV